MVQLTPTKYAKYATDLSAKTKALMPRIRDWSKYITYLVVSIVNVGIDLDLHKLYELGKHFRLKLYPHRGAHMKRAHARRVYLRGQAVSLYR
jgi:hypothetical protein